MVRLGPDKVRGVDLELKWGQERAYGGKNGPRSKTGNQKMAKKYRKDSVWTTSRIYPFRGRDKTP